MLTNPYGFSCCGASYSKAMKPRITAKHEGIRICEGRQFTEENTDERQIKHVETRNGTITVVVRKK